MKIGRPILVIVLLLVGLIAVNYLASSLPLRIDATADHIYTLSPGTKAILSKLEEPVRIDFYYSASVGGIRVSMKNFAARVEEMLRLYVRASGGHVVLNVIDPKTDTPAEEQATAAGITGQPLPGGENFYFGVVATHADKREVVALTPQREPFLEYDITRAIYTVQLLEKKKLGLLTSMPLRGEADFQAMQSGRMPQDQLVLGEWERDFDIVDVKADASELPAGLDALAIIQPEGVSEKLQFAIDQFLLSGKPVFLAVDPSARTIGDRSRQQMMMGGPTPGVSSDLPVLLSGWGIAYNPANVVGDRMNGSQVQTGAGQIATFPHWIGLTKDNIDRNALPTAQLESLLFVEPGSVSLKEGVTGLTLTPLARTSDEAGDIPAAMLQMGMMQDIGSQLTISGRKTIAALVQGRFKSAFPNGAPADAPVDDKGKKPDETKPASAAPVLKESSGTSMLFIVADADWLMDDYSVRRMNFLGMQAYDPMNDNLAFASNAIDFMSGSDDLISIRGKGSGGEDVAGGKRPFIVVREMQAAAQGKYQEQLTALEARISDVQKKLSELQGKRNEGNRLVASPEVTKAIEDFQKQQAANRSERRKIKAALRADIQKLEYTLAVLNLAAPVVLIGLFGLWFYRHRRKAKLA